MVKKLIAVMCITLIASSSFAVDMECSCSGGSIRITTTDGDKVKMECSDGGSISCEF